MLRCNMYVPEDTLEWRPAVDRFSPGGRVAAIDCAERALGCCVRGQPEGNLSYIGDPSAGNDLVPRATDFISDIGAVSYTHLTLPTKA